MRAREFITEIKGCGDCFEVAGRAMITPEVPEIKLVHAYVTGQGPVAGKRFSHAWNEIGDVVLDYSNGRQVVMRKPQYYQLGQITMEPGEYAVYDDTEAKKRMVQTRHWGPWDLDLAREKIDENFADGRVKGVRAYHGNQGGIDTEQLHTPMWFTSSRRDAEQYAGDDGYVVVVNLDIKNPYRLRAGEEANTVLRRWQELQAQGYDGIHDRSLGDWIPFAREQIRVISKDDTFVGENFADGKVKGKSRPGRVKRSGASCKGSVTDLRSRARKYGGERGKMYQWCLNMKAGRQKSKK